MSEAGKLRPNSLGTAHIVFFVVAAAAPLTAVLGASPAAFAFGNGPGVPVVYIMIGLLYLLFSAGFTAMSPYVQSASGFYAYVVQGFGRPAGASVAAAAVASYQAIALAAYGLFGFFAHQFASGLGLDVPWWMAVIPLLLIVQLCGQRAISFSGNILAVCMFGEIAILLALCVAVFATSTTPLTASIPAGSIFAPGLGVAIVFVVASFIGFEATVIFGEEARTPGKTIPRATYAAVILISVFYGLCTLSASRYYGPSNILAAAAHDPGELYLKPIEVLLGKGALIATEGLLLTSLFACVLSFHATVARYLASLAAQGMAPQSLGQIHATHGSPHVAGLVHVVVTLGMIGLAAIAGVDPFAGLFGWAGAFASLGILGIQIATSVSVYRFFRHSEAAPSFAKRVAAPLLSAAGLFACLILAVINLPLIAGSDSRLVLLLPCILVTIAVVGWRAGIGLSDAVAVEGIAAREIGLLESRMDPNLCD